MSIFKRTERGRLSVDYLNLQILLDDLLEIANTEKEVDWLVEQIEDCLGLAQEEKIESLESGDEE